MKVKHVWIKQQVLDELLQSGYAPGHRLPTKQELAVRYGVSIGTISRALDTLCREGWIECKRGSGIYASALVAPRVKQIAFVLGGPADVVEHTYHGPLFRALCDACADSDVKLMVAPTPVDEYSELPERYPHTAFYIVAPPLHSVEVLNRLIQQGISLVVVGASWEEDVAFPTVDSDNRDGARRGVEYLLHLGHRRIAYVNGSEHSANCRDRLAGYYDALKAWNIEAKPHWIIRPDDDTHLSVSAQNALVDTLLMPDRPTAVFCAGYFLTLDVLAVARQLALSVPQQLSVLGTDDPVSARYLNPPLTTLRQPLYEIGRRAADILLKGVYRLDSSTMTQKRLPVELVIRGSCASPEE